jgi:hypothetical protein
MAVRFHVEHSHVERWGTHGSGDAGSRRKAADVQTVSELDMTTQTKRFIELSDILALRFECKHCGCELLISSLHDMSKREEQGKLNDCPVCRKPWASVNGSTCESAIAEVLSSLNKLRRLIGTHQDAFPAGFALTVEIKGKEQDKEEQK